MSIDVLLLIITILLGLVAIFLIPALIQFKSTTQRLDELAREAQRDLLPMLREMRETSEHLNRVARDAQEGLREAGPLFESLGDVGESIHRVTAFFRGDLGQQIGNAIGLWLGIRAASKAVLKKVKHTKGGD